MACSLLDKFFTKNGFYVTMVMRELELLRPRLRACKLCLSSIHIVSTQNFKSVTRNFYRGVLLYKMCKILNKIVDF